MRSGLLGAALFMSVLLPDLGNTQAFAGQDQPPVVTAATAEWQIQRAPLFYAGAFYYPTGPTVFFDPHVMVRSGEYQRVPLYSDTTLEPFSVVYVPIGGNVMRPYERRRAGTLTGTVGSRTPSFPIARDVDVSATVSTTGLEFPPRDFEPAAELEAPAPVGTAGVSFAPPAPAFPARSIAPSRSERTLVESIPRPRSNDGVWLEYGGGTWHADGNAVRYAADRFVEIGTYHGFPVFRDREEPHDRIYIPAVIGGPLTRYKRP